MRSAGSWITDGFKVGMQVRVTGTLVNGASILDIGLPGMYTISALTATTMTLANVALPPTLSDRRTTSSSSRRCR